MVFNSLSRLTAKQLILSNIYLGDNIKFFNVKIKPYLLGKRANSHIINIYYTKIQFKVIINLILNLVYRRQNILIVKELDFFNITTALNFKNLFYYDKKWIGGVLTNFSIINQSKKFLETNNKLNSLGVMGYLPALIFIFNLNISKNALFEAFNLEIPTSAIINTSSQNFELINYPVLGNNTTFESLYYYALILKNSFIQGKQKEKLKILRVL